MLGRCFADRFETFASPFAGLPNADDAVSFILSQGHSLAAAGAAKTIHELFIMQEMQMTEPSLPLSTWSAWWMGSVKQKVPAEFALKMGVVFGARGVVFGGEYPDRFEELYNGSYANVDVEMWHRAHKAGLGIPAEPDKFVPIEDREREAVEGFSEFCREFWPEYMKALGLS